jgi:serine/threonine protein kinase
VSPFREAGTLVQLNDLHVVRIYDLHETVSSYVLLMEAVQGATFADVIADGGASVGMCLRLIAQAAKGLAYVHASGLVHRDVKPSNVLVSSEGVVKLADFGLVSSHKADPLGNELDPRAGTKAYQPPEQVEGRGVSPASDVYALGLVAVEMLGAPALAGLPHVRRMLNGCHARRVRGRPRSGYEMLVEFERASDRDLPAWRSAPIVVPVTSRHDTDHDTDDDTDDDTVVPDQL